MPTIEVAESQRIPAPASVVYGIIADYRTGHPSILPAQYFGRLDVLEGGVGAGTRIRFEMKAFGRVNVAEGVVTEPVPGRELRETLVDGIVTTFVVEPEGTGQSRVTIRSKYERSGVRGWIERLLVPRFLRQVYVAELAQLARVATERAKLQA